MQVLTRGGHCARPSLWDDLFVTFARFVRVRDSGLRDATRRPRWRAPKLSMLGHGEKCILVACEICYGTAISCDRPAALKRDFPPHVYTHDRPHGTGTRRKWQDSTSPTRIIVHRTRFGARRALANSPRTVDTATDRRATLTAHHLRAPSTRRQSRRAPPAAPRGPPSKRPHPPDRCQTARGNAAKAPHRRTARYTPP